MHAPTLWQPQSLVLRPDEDARSIVLTPTDARDAVSVPHYVLHSAGRSTPDTRARAIPIGSVNPSAYACAAPCPFRIERDRSAPTTSIDGRDRESSCIRAEADHRHPGLPRQCFLIAGTCGSHPWAEAGRLGLLPIKNPLSDKCVQVGEITYRRPCTNGPWEILEDSYAVASPIVFVHQRLVTRAPVCLHARAASS